MGKTRRGPAALALASSAPWWRLRDKPGPGAAPPKFKGPASCLWGLERLGDARVLAAVWGRGGRGGRGLVNVEGKGTHLAKRVSGFFPPKQRAVETDNACRHPKTAPWFSETEKLRPERACRQLGAPWLPRIDPALIGAAGRGVPASGKTPGSGGRRGPGREPPARYPRAGGSARAPRGNPPPPPPGPPPGPGAARLPRPRARGRARHKASPAGRAAGPDGWAPGV